MKLPNTRNYIIIEKDDELYSAMQNMYCRFIIQERANTIFLWHKVQSKWKFYKFSFFGESAKSEDGTRGIEAYQRFYKYCGKEKIEEMKKVLPNIEIWESEEQLHYYNPKYANKLLKGNFYEIDINSSFTNGVLKLSDDFILLKKYMLELYDKKMNAKNKKEKIRNKNLQNFLIGYFARIKDFVSLRSQIIKNSNDYVIEKIALIERSGGVAYLSNTDSIITNDVGYNLLKDFIGDEVGMFKLEIKSNKLYYQSSNCYQIGNKLVYSGVRYFARKHTNLYTGQTAKQNGELIKGYDFDLEALEEEGNNICKIKESKIIVTVYNKIGEEIDRIIYKINLEDIEI